MTIYAPSPSPRWASHIYAVAFKTLPGPCSPGEAWRAGLSRTIPSAWIRPRIWAY